MFKVKKKKKNGASRSLTAVCENNFLGVYDVITPSYAESLKTAHPRGPRAPYSLTLMRSAVPISTASHITVYLTV